MCSLQLHLRPHPHRMHVRKFKCKPFDVAGVQCEHSHSRTQVPFVLRRVARPVWMRPHTSLLVFLIRRLRHRGATGRMRVALLLLCFVSTSLALPDLHCDYHCTLLRRQRLNGPGFGRPANFTQKGGARSLRPERSPIVLFEDGGGGHVKARPHQARRGAATAAKVFFAFHKTGHSTRGAAPQSAPPH